MANPSRWRQILRHNFTSLEKLSSFLTWDAHLQDLVLTKATFPLNLPLRLAQKIAKNTLDDPILQQFLPMKTEREQPLLNHSSLERLPLFSKDPVQDMRFAKEAKLLQKYHGRALLLVSSACAMNCRFCFRQHFPYEREHKNFTKELLLLRENSSIEEVILSGGDPLSLDNADLFALLDDLATISHIKRIRFHTRFPLGIPERIDEELLAYLSTYAKQLFFAIHTNHAKEFDDDIFQALHSLHKLGIPILSQTVLLHGINDQIETLVELYTTLVNHGILPYYLHQLDPIEGSHPFFVPKEHGQRLIQELQRRLSGYAVPKYVEELPGAASKTAIISL